MSECNDTCKYYKNCWSRGEGLKEDGEECSHYEPDRPHGEWVRYIDDDGFAWAKCSLCQWDSGEAFEYAIDRFDFCPNCGAKM